MVDCFGVVISFTLEVEVGGDPQIYYSVHTGLSQNPDADSSWRDPTLLMFPKQICTVGREVIAVKLEEPAPTFDANFAVTADSAYIYVFRSSKNKTIYCDKFVYDQVSGAVINATQVRYRRSRKVDLPLDRKDTFGHTDMNDRPFLEPTTELDFLSGLIPGRFDVAILPTQLTGVTRWQIICENATSNKLVSYSILRSSDGGFDLDDSLDPATGEVLPDATFDLVDESKNVLALNSGISMIRYDQQEWQKNEYEKVTLQKREVRVMASLSVGPNSNIAILDFGIGNDGKLTQVGDSLTVDTTPELLQGALQFDPTIGSQVAIPPILTGASITVEAWIAPSVNDSDAAIVLSSADSEDVPFTLGVDNGIPYFVGPNGKTVAGTEVLSVHDWTHIAAVYDNTATIYINGQPHISDNGVSGKRGTAPKSGFLLGGDGSLTGDITAIRIWNMARTQADILSTMNSIVTNQSPDWSKLVGYWLCEEPSDKTRFTTVANSASNGSVADGVLTSAQWVPSRAPTFATGVPVTYDDNGLTVMTGLLGYAVTDVTPSLYEGSDSLVHLYYSAKTSRQASAAHFSPVVMRSSYLVPWKAEDKSTKANTQSGQLSFVARLASTAMNNTDLSLPFIAIKATKSSCQVTLTSYTGYSEVWPKVPSGVDDFIQVINGLASQLSNDPAQADDEGVVYDYSKVKVTTAGGQTGPAPAAGIGSALFRVLVDSQPDNGFPALVQSVTQAEPAERGRVGAGGCWMPYSPLLGIDMQDVGQFIEVMNSTQIDKYNGSLVLDRDLAIEAWIKPIGNGMSSAETLFVFNKKGAVEKDTTQYILGLNNGQPYAGKDDTVNVASKIISLSGKEWTHLAASYRTSFGLQLGGARYLDAGKNENMNTPDAVTVESWVRLDSLGGNQIILAKTNPQEGSSWLLYVNSVGKVVFKVMQATQTGTLERTVTSATALDTGQWHYLAGVYDTAFEKQVAIMFAAGNFVKIPEVGSPPTDGVSIMMWIKRVEDSSSSEEVLFQNVDPQLNMTFSLSLYKGVPQFSVSYGTDQYMAKDTVTLRRDDWVHISGTFDPANGASLIIDGVLIETGMAKKFDTRLLKKSPETIIAGEPAAYTVGGIAQNYTFIGTINEVSLWNRCLSLDEVRQKIMQPLASTEIGLSGYWRFNDLFGTTVMDLAGTANGDLVGGNFIRIDKGAFAHKIFIDGRMEAFERVVDPIALCDSRVALGSGYFESYLQGSISETRLWKNGRMNWQIDYFMTQEIEGNARGLISNWTFRTGKGAVVFDKKSDNNAKILDGKSDLTDKVVDAMWLEASFKASWTFYVNGEKVESSPGVLPSGDYGDSQANIGAFVLGGSISRFFTGQMSQLRIWNSQRTGAQVRGSMFTRLSGNTPGLAAFWGLDNGSGSEIADISGWGNTGTWIGGANPVWITSTAPVGLEEPAIQSVPGDVAKPENLTTNYAPVVSRYGQTQVDARGNLYASMLQTLAVVDAQDSEVCLFSDFKIGDLILQFIGQAQVDPTLIGFIEGAPPLPAENLKLYPGDPLSYVGASTIMIDETDTKTYTYTASRDVGNAVDVSMRLGFNVEGETSAGIGVQQKVYSFGIAGGLAIQTDETTSVLGEGMASEELSVMAQKYMESRGAWYPNTYNIDNGVGDIFYPNNIGYALVRSGTADLYAMRIEATGTLVGYTAQANPDIPEDMNIIMFKIDDQYVKNGTLDGWIGFQPDTSYPNLQPGEHASYFKPLEAYAIKASIEREQQQRKAYFENFDAEALGQRADVYKPNSVDVADTGQNLVNALIGMDQKTSLSVDQWREKMARRSLANTYVWTSDGGMYSEQQQFMALREESSGGSYSMSAKAGIYTELTLSVGPTFNLDAMFGTTITTQSQKTDHDSAQFSLQVDLMGDQRYIGLVEEDQGDYIYTNDPSPGKVQGYRFMSFYRAPSKQNFETFSSVVDQDWLNGQGAYAGKYDPDALALRSALNNPNEVWRVLHRVTYVSRTPPTTQNEGQSLTPDVRKPDEDSVISNSVMIAELPADLNAENPMSKVSEEADVLLAEMVKNPVWGAALAENLAEHKKDIMEYMRSYYGIPS